MVVPAFRPRFADFALKMKRGAQVVYPKDLGPILIYADVFPGARVLEAGTGSGALTIALCRATGTTGRVVSYEPREEHRAQAVRNIEGFFGKLPDTLDLRPGDRLRCRPDGGAVRPLRARPARAVGPARRPRRRCSSRAGSLCGYMPTTVQVQQFVLALAAQGFQHLETFEVLRRAWHVTERSVRPDHRMVGHTGFLSSLGASV